MGKPRKCPAGSGQWPVPSGQFGRSAPLQFRVEWYVQNLHMPLAHLFRPCTASVIFRQLRKWGRACQSFHSLARLARPQLPSQGA